MKTKVNIVKMKRPIQVEVKVKLIILQLISIYRALCLKVNFKKECNKKLSKKFKSLKQKTSIISGQNQVVFV